HTPVLGRFSLLSHTAAPRLHTLSLHDALPILIPRWPRASSSMRWLIECKRACRASWTPARNRNGSAGLMDALLAMGRSLRIVCRSEEHTSELQSRSDLVCRLLLEKKNKTLDDT